MAVTKMSVLAAIREDRTRGGRSTYQCSYTLPASLMSAADSPRPETGPGSVKLETGELPNTRLIPPLLQVRFIHYHQDTFQLFSFNKKIVQVRDIKWLIFKTSNGWFPCNLARTFLLQVISFEVELLA